MMTAFEAGARRLATAALFLGIGLGVMGSRAGANPAEGSDQPARAHVAAETVQTPSEETPEQTQPDATPPEETPEQTQPEGTPPEETQPDGTTGSGETTTDPTSAAVAIAGFAVLLGFATWWMLRHEDPDDEPYPHPADDSEGPTDQMI